MQSPYEIQYEDVIAIMAVIIWPHLEGKATLEMAVKAAIEFHDEASRSDAAPALRRGELWALRSDPEPDLDHIRRRR
jgi:hypothetical protein